MADEQDPKNNPVTGVFRPGPRRRLGADEHHIGWDHALQNALDNIGRPRGRYNVQVVFSAVVQVTNPGHVIEYKATVI